MVADKFTDVSVYIDIRVCTVFIHITVRLI